MTAPMNPPTDEQLGREEQLMDAVAALIKASYLAAGGSEARTGAILIQAATVWWHGAGGGAGGIKAMAQAVRRVAPMAGPWTAEVVAEIRAELDPVLSELRMKHAAGIPTKGGDS